MFVTEEFSSKTFTNYHNRCAKKAAEKRERDGLGNEKALQT